MARYPVLAEYRQWLGQFGDARMTGSGACIFAAFPDQQSAQAVIDRLPNGMHGWLAEGLAKHPLLCLAD